MKLPVLALAAIASFSMIQWAEAATKREVLAACEIMASEKPPRECVCPGHNSNGELNCIVPGGGQYLCPIKGECDYLPPKKIKNSNRPTFQMILKNPGKYKN